MVIPFFGCESGSQLHIAWKVRSIMILLAFECLFLGPFVTTLDGEREGRDQGTVSHLRWRTLKREGEFIEVGRTTFASFSRGPKR